MSNIISINNLNYKNILNNINLNIKEKTFNIIIGSNGCGKTTLINCLLGLYKYSGNIDKPLIYEIGVVKNNNQLIDGTVIYNIKYPLINLGKSEKEAKNISYEMLKAFNLENLSYKNVKHLNYLEKKMISFIISFVHNPKLIIIDNDIEDLPFSFKEKLLKYLKRINKISTIIFVTNNSKYLKLADNIIAMNKGNIIKTGSYREIVEDDSILKIANMNKPFLEDLCGKLILYEMLDEKYSNIDDLVMELWK